MAESASSTHRQSSPDIAAASTTTSKPAASIAVKGRINLSLRAPATDPVTEQGRGRAG